MTVHDISLDLCCLCYIAARIFLNTVMFQSLCFDSRMVVHDSTSLYVSAFSVVQVGTYTTSSLYHPKGQTLFFNFFMLKCFIGS